MGFTARMEEELDEIEEGKLPWKQAVGEFYERFVKDLALARDEMESYKRESATEEIARSAGRDICWSASAGTGFSWAATAIRIAISRATFHRKLPRTTATAKRKWNACPECGKEMVIKRGRFGTFLACSGYPDCKTTRRLVQGTRKARQPDEMLDEKCPDCGAPLVKRWALRRIHRLLGYPKCKFIRAKTLGIDCPKCGTGELCSAWPSAKASASFYGCNRYPECDFTTPFTADSRAVPEVRRAVCCGKERGRCGAVRACIKEGCDWEIACARATGAAASGSGRRAEPGSKFVGHYFEKITIAGRA